MTTNSSSRLLSLDVFRGITVVLMIIVNSPGNNSGYWWLNHSAWNGCTVADLIFAFFIFIMGVSCSYNFQPNAQHRSWASMSIIAHRACILFLLGLLLNAHLHPSYLEQLRLLGELQRIAICYAFTATMCLTTTPTTQALSATVILIAYWLIIIFFSPSDYTESNNICAYVDQWLLSGAHMLRHNFDPEGLVSTFPALASALIGALAGSALQAATNPLKKNQQLLIAGVMMIGIGFAWSFFFPINKIIWSSSYVMWTSGWALMTLALCYCVIDIHHQTRWCSMFNLFGRHALLAFVLHVFFLKLQTEIVIQGLAASPLNLRQAITHVLFNGLSPVNASLAYALLYLAFWYTIITGYDHYQGRKVITNLVS